MEVVIIPIGKLIPSDDNVRVEPDPEDPKGHLSLLAESIERQGLLNPLSVRPNGGDTYEVIAGLRRLEALKLLGWSEVPCRMLDTDTDAFLLSFEENMQRTPMSHKDKCLAVQRFMRENEDDVGKVAKRINLHPNTVRRYVKISALDEEQLDRLDVRGNEGLTLKEAQSMAERMLQASKGETGDKSHIEPLNPSDPLGLDAANMRVAALGGSASGGDEATGEPKLKKKRKKPVKSEPWIMGPDEEPVPIPVALHPEVYRMVIRWKTENFET